MLVKITDFPDDVAEKLKSLTGQATASKAVYQAACEYSTHLVLIESDALMIQSLRSEVARLSSIIEGARSSAALLLEKTAQGDLLEHRA